ncbi:hypothetical protein U9R62_00945 [Cylindrospermopsis raciborskii DSH]|uniref:hypothetical protein n=1 Tax=Cylindrospermopsis raciborskii TaxID=77022 RepID=UPI002EDA5BC2
MMSQEVDVKNLPLGINTLDKMRGNCLCGQNEFRIRLIKQPGAFFLSLERFGKESAIGYPEGDIRGE